MDRIRALAESLTPPTDALYGLYRALHRTATFLAREELEQLREAFRQEKLLWGEDGSWHSSEGIFQQNPDRIPEAPVVPKDIATLGLWERLHVPRQPTIELLLRWLKRLPTDERLSEADWRRVRHLLQRAPQRIWDEVRCWLDLDHQWARVAELRWKATDPKSILGLFPGVKQEVADVSMLPPELCEQGPFGELPYLSHVMTWRLVHWVPDGAARRPDWMKALAECVLRTRSAEEAASDDDQNEQAHAWREEAERLWRTHWQPVLQLQVMPYLDGRPAGEARFPKALWRDGRLYVHGSGPSVYQELVDELSAAFNRGDIKRAIAECVDRAPDWIRDYFEAHFDLEPVVAGSDEGQRLPTDKAEEPAGTGVAEDESVQPFQIVPSGDGDDQPGGSSDTGGDVPSKPKPQHPLPDDSGDRLRRKLSRRGIFVRWLKETRGFRASDVADLFVDDQGNVVRRGTRPWDWHEFDAQGRLVSMYRVQDGSLDEGVDVPAEVSTMMNRRPEQTMLLLREASDTLRAYSGSHLCKLRSQGVLDLFPGTYRLRKKGA